MYGRVSPGGVILASDPGIVVPSVVEPTNAQKREARLGGTPVVLSGYTPSDGTDRLLIVFGVCRLATAIGVTTKTFGASSFASVISDAAGSRDARILDLSAGTGTGDSAQDITMSFTDTGSDNIILAAMTVHNLAQQTAEASASSGGIATYDVADNIDATVTPLTAGAYIASMCYQHSGTAVPTIDGAGVQSSLITMEITAGSPLYCRIGWSLAPSTAAVTHRYHVSANGNQAGWIIGAWEPAP